VRRSVVDRRQSLRVQLAFRFGGLLVLAAMSPALRALRRDVAGVRISLFVLVYAGVEILLMRRTSRRLTRARKTDLDDGAEVSTARARTP